MLSQWALLLALLLAALYGLLAILRRLCPEKKHKSDTEGIAARMGVRCENALGREGATASD